MCKMYWHPYSLSSPLPLLSVGVVCLSVCLPGMWGSLQLPVIARAIHKTNWYCLLLHTSNANAPVEPQNGKRLPQLKPPPSLLAHLVGQIKLNIYSHLCAILFRFIEAICQRHVLLWLASRRWGNLCHSMSTPRRGHWDPDPVAIAVPVPMLEPLRASSSNSSNRGSASERQLAGAL